MAKGQYTRKVKGSSQTYSERYLRASLKKLSVKRANAKGMSGTGRDNVRRIGRNPR